MKRLFTYSFFLKGVVFFLLVSQLWANTTSYCYWFSDDNMEIVELCDFWDSDSEEEDNKDDKEKKIRTYQSTLLLSNFTLSSLTHQSEKSNFLTNYPEIYTPPPKIFHLFS